MPLKNSDRNPNSLFAKKPQANNTINDDYVVFLDKDETGFPTKAEIHCKTGATPAMGYNTNVKSVEIIGNVEEIRNGCFYECSQLEELTISDNVKILGHHSFFGCYKINNLIIPESVNSIGGQCFAYCNSLTTITFKSVTPPDLGNNAFFSSGNLETIYVPAESVEAYKAANNWSEYADIITAISE